MRGNTGYRLAIIQTGGSWSRAILEALAEEFDFSLDVPFESYQKRYMIFYFTVPTAQ